MNRNVGFSARVERNSKHEVCSFALTHKEKTLGVPAKAVVLVRRSGTTNSLRVVCSKLLSFVKVSELGIID